MCFFFFSLHTDVQSNLISSPRYNPFDLGIICSINIFLGISLYNPDRMPFLFYIRLENVLLFLVLEIIHVGSTTVNDRCGIAFTSNLYGVRCIINVK